jgi:uncharacterized protein YcaQ
LQLDPTAAVARSEHLVLWSRIGDFDVAALDRALYRDRQLFEYGSWILPISDFDFHREAMRRYLQGSTARQRYVRGWLEANAGFRAYVLAQVRSRGPLRSRDFEDRASVPWRTGGWNDGKNVGRLLDALWAAGDLAIVGREGSQRIWDLAARGYPRGGRAVSARAAALRRMESQLRARGVARAAQFGYSVEGRLASWMELAGDLESRGIARRVRVKGLPGEWYAHRSALERRRFVPRTTLLSPFDQLVADRARTEELFGFRFKLEIYVPPAKREHGYYVMPILAGDRLVGRIDPLFDRKTRTLRVRRVYAEPGAAAASAAGIAAAIAGLARWLGADGVELGEAPAVWARALRSRATAGPA